MSLKLEADEPSLRKEIEERMEKARQAFEQSRIGDDVAQLIAEAGERAHQLHLKLKARGHEPKHHGYMIRNRELQPDDPKFYMHYHPIEDLLKFLDNENANDDPQDQTLGDDFTFSVFSKRWGHPDTYKVKRTEDGWHISHIVIGGPCDKGGRPFLFENLRHDSIHYPDGLDGWMEWLWSQAASKGLSHEQVQVSLQQLADWITITEKGAPADGVWEGY